MDEKSTMRRFYAGLAEGHGLALVRHGGRTKVFRGLGAHDFHEGGELGTYRSQGEVEAFLDGFDSACAAPARGEGRGE